MNSEKVKEIKKALELNEYYAIEYFPKSGEPKVFRFNDILTLINELESENERLSKENFVLYRDRFTKKELDDISACRVTKATKELKDRIAELEEENAKLLDSVETVQSNRCVYKCVLTKEHLTKFAERLKEKLPIYYPSTIEAIDETLKECL